MTHPAGTTLPTRTNARIEALDVLRGAAIVGTLATNIWILTDPEGMVGYVGRVGGSITELGWPLVERVAQQLAQGKFLGLLTIMFGIGLELQRRSAARRGDRWPGRFLVRSALLLLDGVLNFVLVAEFDVLTGYAITGVVVAYLMLTSERAQRAWLIACAAVHAVLLTTLAAAVALAGEQPAGPPLTPNPYADGSFLDLVAFRLENVIAFRLETVLTLAYAVAMFLAGSLLVRAGVLEPGRRVLRSRLMVVGVLALAVDLPLGLLGGSAGLLLARYGTAAFVALGLLAAGVAWVQARPHGGWFRARLADIGRTALSCYLAQNLIGGWVCYGWGLGLAATMPERWRVSGTIGLGLHVI